MVEQPLRVLHITEGYDGGVVTYLRHVLPAQRARGLDVSLVCCPRREPCEEGLDILCRQGIHVSRLRMSRGIAPWTDATALAALTHMIRHERYDIVHTHCFKAGILGRVAARLTRACRVVHTPHCWPSLRSESRAAAWACRAVDNMLEHWTDCLLLVSESERQESEASDIGLRAYCEVIPNGIPILPNADHLCLRSELGLSPASLVVGTLCRLVSYKCVDHFVQAAAHVHEQLPEVVFLIVGDGPQQCRVRRLVRSLRMEKSIHMLGHRSDAERIIALLDLCVLCSRAEGMSYVLLEAMRSSVAVVASRVPGNVDVISDERVGFLYEWGDITGLAQSMIRCLQDDHLRKRVANEARRYVTAHHDVERQVDKMVHLYRRLLSAKPAPCSVAG